MAACRLLRTAIGLAAFFFLALVAHAGGGLDPTFGSRGLVKTQVGRDSIAYAVRVQPDGKIVIGGFGSIVAQGQLGHEWIVARYTQAGALDPSFDGDGIAVTSFSSRPVPFESVQDVALQRDGKIVAAGTTVVGNAEHFALARYNPDGSLDSSFGSGGKVVTEFGTAAAQPSDDRATSMALAGDGKIVVAGTTTPAGNLTDWDFALVRYEPDGTLDRSFGDGGKVVTDLGADDVANDVAVLGDGKVVVAGVKGDITGPEPHIALARYNADGTLDKSFGSGGEVLPGIGIATSVLVQPDGKLLLAGGHDRTEMIPSDAFLERFTADGVLDKTYGGGGSANFGALSIKALGFDSRGKTLAVGTASPSGDFLLARFTKSGAYDRALEPDFGVLPSYGLAVDKASDGKIIVAGTASNEGSQYSIALARFLPVKCVVPKLVGKSLPQARLAIPRAACRLGSVRLVASSVFLKNRVIEQTPRAAVQLAEGSRVNLIVSRGRKRR